MGNQITTLPEEITNVKTLNSLFLDPIFNVETQTENVRGDVYEMSYNQRSMTS